MLRPATPLSIIFFVAFVLLLLSTLSTPIIKSIPLGRFQKYNFGVLGYCHDDGTCVGPRLGYSTDGLFNSDGNGGTDGDFTLPSSTRHSLSSILIIHPIAALLALVCFGLACAAHFRGPSHSPRYLLALLILTIPTLLCTILAFLVDILLWVPHMQWGGWIVLGATILIIASSIVTCAMRRTLVSRKARKKRIAENADMNGSTYYETLAQQRMMNDETLPKADSPPPLSGSTAVEKLDGQQYATYEMKREGGTSHGDDDRTPLNPPSSIRSASAHGDMAARRPYGDDGAPPMPAGAGTGRDQYGNVVSVPGASGAGLRHQHSQGSLNSNRSNGYARGRGGYGPPPRGYGPPRGRGGYGPRGGFRGGPPPPGWNGRGRGGYGHPGMMMGRGGGPRPGPPPGYAGNQSYGAPPRDPYSAGPARDPYGPAPPRDPYGTAPSRDPYGTAPPRDQDQFVAGPFIGQAIEMDERTGSPQGAQPAYVNNNYGLRDSDGDVMGMVGLQGGLSNSTSDSRPPRSDMRSPTNMYSNEQYVPPRRQWDDQHSPQPQHQGLALPDAPRDSYATNGHSSAAPSSGVLPMSPLAASATTHSPTGTNPRHSEEAYTPANTMPARNRAYSEDVDPRFIVADDENKHQSILPSALTPGAAAPRSPPPGMQPLLIPQPQSPDAGTSAVPQTEMVQHTPSPRVRGGPTSDEDSRNQLPLSNDGGLSTRQVIPSNSEFLEPIPDGSRSPGEGSEASHFTSVSQRGINPNWMPPPGMGRGGMSQVSSASAAQRRKEDVILTANPDFSLPGMPGQRGRGRGGLGPATMSGRGPMGGGVGLTPAGRYPVADI